MFGLPQRGHEFDFPLETQSLPCTGQCPTDHDLDRNRTLGVLLHRLVDHALSTAMDLAENPVARSTAKAVRAGTTHRCRTRLQPTGSGSRCLHGSWLPTPWPVHWIRSAKSGTDLQAHRRRTPRSVLERWADVHRRDRPSHIHLVQCSEPFGDLTQSRGHSPTSHIDIVGSHAQLISDGFNRSAFENDHFKGLDRLLARTGGSPKSSSTDCRRMDRSISWSQSSAMPASSGTSTRDDSPPDFSLRRPRFRW